jgi:DNA invertase Pin-like site-specific DNA recombinase
MTEQDHTKDTLFQSGRAVIYRRVAPRAQTQASQSQMAALIAFAKEQGFSNERIIVYEEVKALAERPLARHDALSDLLAAVMRGDQTPEQEPIKAIYVSSEARLFRDANSVDLTYFIGTCADHGVQILTPTAAYDFTDPEQVALFRYRCERAASYIAGQIGMLRQRGRTRGSTRRSPAEE